MKCPRCNGRIRLRLVGCDPTCWSLSCRGACGWEMEIRHEELAAILEEGIALAPAAIREGMICPTIGDLGLSLDEVAVMVHLVQAWDGYLALDVQHPNDLHEFQRALHELQRLLAVRIVRREYPMWYSDRT